MNYPENYKGAITSDGTVNLGRFPCIFPHPVIFTILQSKDKYMPSWCGYVRFMSRPLRERGYKGIATYVPVHGGITYAEDEGKQGMVYGFDCGHAGDDKNPQVTDKVWLMQECRNMAVSILLAARYESHYLLAKTEKEKALVVDKYHDDLKKNYGIEFVLKDNFGAMINVMFGGL